MASWKAGQTCFPLKQGNRLLIAHHRNTQLNLESVADMRTDKAHFVGEAHNPWGAEVEQGEDHWTAFISTAPDSVFPVSSRLAYPEGLPYLVL